MLRDVPTSIDRESAMNPTSTPPNSIGRLAATLSQRSGQILRVPIQ
jgi:hypothetical protein